MARYSSGFSVKDYSPYRDFSWWKAPAIIGLVMGGLVFIFVYGYCQTHKEYAQCEARKCPAGMIAYKPYGNSACICAVAPE